MKSALAPLLAALFATLTVPAFAAKDHADHAAMHAEHGAAATLADGLVKKVDKAAGRVTLTHGPLPNGMPAMTMAFRVKDASWLDKLKEGDKIRFAAEQINGVMTVTQIERP